MSLGLHPMHQPTGESPSALFTGQKLLRCPGHLKDTSSTWPGQSGKGAEALSPTAVGRLPQEGTTLISSERRQALK